MKYLFVLLVGIHFYCIRQDLPGYGVNRKGCYKVYANDREFGLCSKERLALFAADLQNPNSELSEAYKNDPNFYNFGNLLMCREVQKRKKECDSQHVDLNP